MPIGLTWILSDSRNDVEDSLGLRKNAAFFADHKTSGWSTVLSVSPYSGKPSTGERNRKVETYRDQKQIINPPGITRGLHTDIICVQSGESSMKGTVRLSVRRDELKISR